MNIREQIQRKIPVLFDGAMGTYFTAKRFPFGDSCEMANRTHPELIREIHREYLSAGCRAIKTNTFGLNRLAYHGDEETVTELLQKGWQIAREAAEAKASVFADLGPVAPEEGETNVTGEFLFLAEHFLALGAENFLFETNSSPEGLAEAAQFIKQRNPNAFIIVSFAVQPDGTTSQGYFASDLLRQMNECPAVDSIGFNCVSSAGHMLSLLQTLDLAGKPLCVMPNAGYPEVHNGRVFYEGDPLFFAETVAKIVDQGAALVGGCCGTTPIHIAKCAEILQEKTTSFFRRAEEVRPALPSDPVISRFWEKLKNGEKVVAVELDPPDNPIVDKFMSGAWQLKNAGTDIITIADCPIGRARMDSAILSCKIRRELGIDALPHMTCRDRNLNATKALLFGMYAEGIRNILIVTGDPIPTAQRDEVKTVYQFNSRRLAAFLTSLSEKKLPGELHLFAALNLNARNFDIQLGLARQKEANGIVGFLTQPILTQTAFENLKKARKELKGYLLGGIMPIVSEKNARFLDSEVNGVHVDPEIISFYAGKNREEGEALALDISTRIAKEIAPFVDGWYLVTPFGRTQLMAKILEEIKELK